MTTTPTDRRKAIEDATAQRIGELLHEARRTNDPMRMLDIKGEIEKLDSTLSLDMLLTLGDFILDAPKTDIKKATGKKEKAAAALIAKRAELAATAERLNREIDEAIDAQRNAIAEHAAASVSNNRLQALQTGIAEPGYQDYARPAIRCWAKLENLIK